MSAVVGNRAGLRSRSRSTWVEIFASVFCASCSSSSNIHRADDIWEGQYPFVDHDRNRCVIGNGGPGALALRRSRHQAEFLSMAAASTRSGVVKPSV